ncbi:MAG: hypothetical protein GDA43_26460 [Hormoscilla sp. SP5CHS1]|nr:hypothetical protein [Hormoscilla sp. SP5CHS1]
MSNRPCFRPMRSSRRSGSLFAVIWYLYELLESSSSPTCTGCSCDRPGDRGLRGGARGEGDRAIGVTAAKNQVE